MRRATLLMMMVCAAIGACAQTAISSNDDLLGMVANGNYYLTTDLELEGWVPMPDFRGTLDGRGHIIVLANGQLDGNGSAGLFSNTHGAVIKNLIVGGMFDDIKGVSGGLVARATNTTFINCEMETTLVSNDKTVLMGGLVGIMDGGLMVNCSSRGFLEGYLLGGLAGSTQNGATIKNCYSYSTFITRTLDDDTQVGGLVHDNAGLLENCYVGMGRDGWYIPSFGQLNQMYALRGFCLTRHGKIPTWTTGYVLSSSVLIPNILMSMNHYGENMQLMVNASNDTQGNPCKYAHEFHGSGYNIGDYIYICGLPTLVFDINENGKGGNTVSFNDDLAQSHLTKMENHVLSDYYIQTNTRMVEYEYALGHDGVTAYGETTLTIPEEFNHNVGKFFTFMLKDNDPNSANKTHNMKLFDNKHQTNVTIKQLAYTSTGTVTRCYYPYDRNIFAVIKNTSATYSSQYKTCFVPYNFGYFGPQIYKGNSLSDIALVDTLNAWVDLQDDDLYSHWAMPNTTFVNFNQPIHKYGFDNGLELVNCCIERGWRFQHKALRYAHINSVNEAQTIWGNTLAYYDNLEGITADNVTHPWGCQLFITEHASLKGSYRLKGNVCITFDNTDASGFAGGKYDWHAFGSTLSDAPVGIDYGPYIYGGLNGNPSQVRFIRADGYFPSTSPYASWDLYSYNEPYDGWANFKRYIGDHYNHHTGMAVNYINETTMIQGKGYLAALKKKTGLQAFGNLNNGNIPITLSRKGNTYPGYNLLSNPYHAYLDFNAFCDDNEAVLTQCAYMILDADHQGYISYCPEASDNPVYAPRYLHPHQGFFIQTSTDESQALFKPSQTVATPSSYFRGEPLSYPLINLSVTDDEGKKDYATAELERPDNGGMVKLNGLKGGKAQLSVGHQLKEYSIAFLHDRPQSIPVHFQADTDGIYTLEWEVRNDVLPYLHLIDNITGNDVDCLTQKSYTFHARKDDYLSRFKLILCPSQDEETLDWDNSGIADFAYPSENGWVVKGQGKLELLDLQGRVLWTKALGHRYLTIALPPFAKGLYLLQLSNPNGTWTQKIIL